MSKRVRIRKGRNQWRYVYNTGCLKENLIQFQHDLRCKLRHKRDELFDINKDYRLVSYYNLRTIRRRNERELVE